MGSTIPLPVFRVYVPSKEKLSKYAVVESLFYTPHTWTYKSGLKYPRNRRMEGVYYYDKVDTMLNMVLPTWTGMF